MQKNINNTYQAEEKIINRMSYLQKRFLSLTNTFDINRKVKQIICLLMISSLIAVSTPAAPLVFLESFLKAKQDTVLLLKLDEWFSFLPWNYSKSSQTESQEERDAKVVKIKIDADGETFLLGRQIPLVAVAYDSNENPVSGVKFEWEVENSESVKQEIVDEIFETKNTGNYTVKVSGAGKQFIAQFTVISPAEALKIKSEESTQSIIPLNEWDVENMPHARKVKNLRGNNPGKPKGKTNFNIVAPVLSVPGRGQDLNLNLNYNSLVWSQIEDSISYDMDKDWLAPGWTMGFGKIVNIINGGIVQFDADGTRRFYAGVPEVNQNVVTHNGQSTDGAFIKSHTETAVEANGACFTNPTTYLKYPNGTTVYYDVWEYRGCYTVNDPITMVPRRITDRHGNHINITYHAPSTGTPTGRWINQISDTLGRIYTFNYTLDSGKYYLTSINGQGLPDENGQTVTRTFVRLQYKNHTITHNFTGLTVNIRENPIKVLSAIYYPATQSGYWFGDTDSYSTYGMIRKVVENRAMNYSPENGITQGTLTRQRIYSYPDNTSSALNDIPAFYDVTETWEGMTVPAQITQYLVDWEANPRTTTTIASDLSRVVEYSYNYSALLDTNQEKIKDGLTYKAEVYDSNNQLRSTSETEWELGYKINTCPVPANGCVEVKIPRPKKVTQTEIDNGRNFTKITNNSFGESGEYNQVLETTEIGYGGPTDILRKTVNEYTKKGDNPVLGDDWRALPRLIGLPTVTQVFDNNNNRIAYTKNEYDLNLVQPFNGANPPSFCTDSYCSAITERGNLSKTTTYENITNTTLTGVVANNLVYDRAGNLVESKPEVSANTLTSYKFNYQTRYAYPEEITTGNDNPNLPEVSVKTTATYNYNTGLTLTTTDADLQTVEYKHTASDWRLKKTILPTGGSTTFDYDDLSRTYSQYSTTATNELAGKQLRKINGLGQVIRQESYVRTDNVEGQNQEVWDVVEVIYDGLGRTKKTSNPFRSNESSTGVYWTEVFYDTLGRVWKTVAPDGSTKFDYYNETARPQGASTEPGKTFRVKDPVGREKWHLTDSDGNVVEVIEPDPNGNGSVAVNGLVTKYTYDKLKRLLQTEQGAQMRKFKYDSLGRLTLQKMAETKATLNDNGTFVGEGSGTWSDFYAYDKFSNVVSQKDARGVTTNSSYTNPAAPQYPIDPLNRIFAVSYNTNGATDVLPSPTVNFTYQSSGNVAQLKTVTTANVNTIELDYDNRGRISQKKHTILNRPTYPMVVNYNYDSLNRITDVTYPDQYGTGSTRKVVHNDFDTAGRTTALKVDGTDYASDFVFNNFNQVTSVKIGPSGTNQINETYSYNSQNSLLQNQKILKGGNALLDLSYEYQQCSCSTGGSGQITKITNNLDRNRDRGYEYDTLSRLRKVTGGINKTWSQNYTYNRYGNRESVVSLGVEAFKDSNVQVSDSKDEQNKLIKQSVPNAFASNAQELVSDVKKSINISEANKTESSSNSLNKTENINSKPANEASNKTKDKQSVASTTSEESVNPPGNNAPFDFDNDGKADVSVWNKSNGIWGILQSSNNQTILNQFGANGDQIAPGDYDGDGKTDMAVWRPSNGVWYILQSSNGLPFIQAWGIKDDSIMPADYDGDGRTDLAVFRPSTGYWYVQRSSDNGLISVNFGGQQFGDIPVAADFDGDNKADVAVWRPQTGDWIIQRSSNAQVDIIHFGASGDVPVQADYDNDGKDDIAVWTPSTGGWYVLKSSNGQVAISTFGGQSYGDMPVPADYDGDGKADVAVWRSSTGAWFILRSTDSGVTYSQLGSTGNIAVPSAFRRRSSAPKNQNKDIPRDGIANLSYDPASNRITSADFIYDVAGNQTQSRNADGTIVRYQYDAAGRLIKVKDINNQTIVTYTYGSSRERLITQEGNESSTNLTYYAWEGSSVISEYTQGAGNILVWAKNYIFMGGSLLATQTKTVSGESLEFAHSDQLGTRVVTNPGDGTFFEQNSLPFGTALDSESSGSINRRFTSYDRSSSTKLDYAVNRFYDSSQGRFTTVDPIKMQSTSLMNPQTLNLFAYTANDPVNRTDPDGQSWLGGIFRFLFGGGTQFNFNFNIGNLPISFGFQGHFKNIYAGIAGFNIKITGKGSLSSLIKSFSAGRNKEALSDCVKNLFAGIFQDHIVTLGYDKQEVGVSIIDAIRFIPGLPIFGKGNIAMTLGLYNVHYDSKEMSLSSPSWADLEVIIEEAAHGDQFIRMWQSMPDIRDMMLGGGAGGRASLGPPRRPTYEEAQVRWGVLYLSASATALADGKSSYVDNEYEIGAKAIAKSTMVKLATKYPKEYANGVTKNQTKLCP